MTKLLCSPSLVCLFLFALTVQGQDRVIHSDDRKAEEVPFAADAEKEEEKEVDGLTKSVDRELTRLKNFTNLGDDAVAMLRLELQPLITTTLKEHPGLNQARIPPDRILDAIVESTSKAVSDKASLARYFDDLTARRTFAEFVWLRK